MMYKLINKETGEEYLCDKVTIDGYDYYVSDENRTVGDFYIGKGFNGDNIFKWYSSQEKEYPNQKGKAIATNNPNIDDVSKVVDEVERLANEFGYHDQKSDTLFREGLILGYNKSQETHPFSEEDVRFMLSEAFKASQEGYQTTSDEIIQLWKEQQPKTLYYE